LDVCQIIKQRLEELGLEQRDLAVAVQVTESYISQLLTRKKTPPAVDRTDLYERMNSFLKLPKGQLSAMVDAQHREELKKKLADLPVPLFKEVRLLIIRKCIPERRRQIRDIFEKQAFGELERLVTQKLLDVTKKIAKDELGNEDWLCNVAQLLGRSYQEIRANTLEFLDTDVFNVSPDHCSAFLDPLIDSWQIDLKTFALEITLNRRLASTRVMKLCYGEIEMRVPVGGEEPGFRDFLREPAMSGDATEEEIDFLKHIRFNRNRPSALYYYRELQSLRDPLHFRENSVAAIHKRRDAKTIEKQIQFDSRTGAIRRWAKNKNSPRKDRKAGPLSPRPRRTDVN
jgi:transcriptional regulator with XRE-family HTH domain